MAEKEKLIEKEKPIEKRKVIEKEKMSEKEIAIGLVETVLVQGTQGTVSVRAKIDTGARRCCIDAQLAKQIGCTEFSEIKVRNATSVNQRKLVDLAVVLKDTMYQTTASVVDREKMAYQFLIGQNLLKELPFLIDPRKHLPRK